MQPASLSTLRDPKAKTTSGFHFASEKSVGLHPTRGSHCICAVCIGLSYPTLETERRSVAQRGSRVKRSAGWSYNAQPHVRRERSAQLTAGASGAGRVRHVVAHHRRRVRRVDRRRGARSAGVPSSAPAGRRRGPLHHRRDRGPGARAPAPARVAADAASGAAGSGRPRRQHRRAGAARRLARRARDGCPGVRLQRRRRDHGAEPGGLPAGRRRRAAANAEAGAGAPPGAGERHGGRRVW